jgi:phosphate starvation-inducible PhoH-like protein
MRFTERDVVRHRLVQAIIRAYDRREQRRQAPAPPRQERGSDETPSE